ncbi:MAG: hypothetical protein COA62_01515 [Rhodobiaceae bacterium]|nr:MAG: hypothetical protein COA62_01515 [Rhodobiaceae bacterium]
MNYRLVLLGTLAYALVTFPLAVVWHVVLFEQKYISFGYFEGEPNFVLGFLIILIQGLMLSILYPHVSFSGNGTARGIKYALFIGLFFWTSHVLAFIAKQIITDPLLFIAMESFYLLLQFGIFGALIGVIYKKQLDEAA